METDQLSSQLYEGHRRVKHLRCADDSVNTNNKSVKQGGAGSKNYLMSRINYRSCALNLRQQDIQKIQAATKSWVTQGYLLKPNEVLLYRNPEEGGLGVVHAASRCKANLIKTFISQGDPRS